ncbi:MAG TPA: hypothetical protein VJX67_01540 [Blastocatellia bacterium]|nr:hypothetical protein [Blastocatellia bacterium]
MGSVFVAAVTVSTTCPSYSCGRDPSLEAGWYQCRVLVASGGIIGPNLDAPNGPKRPVLKLALEPQVSNRMGILSYERALTFEHSWQLKKRESI